MKTAHLNTRLEVSTKKHAEAVFRKIGLSPSDAVRLFYKQVALSRGLPFEVKIPNAKTRAAMRELDSKNRSALKRFGSYEDLMADLLTKRRGSKKRG